MLRRAADEAPNGDDISVVDALVDDDEAESFFYICERHARCHFLGIVIFKIAIFVMLNDAVHVLFEQSLDFRDVRRF